ncbi:MAG: Type 1 glutamine amidotransferase-like domain-containing protein [bacterium]|nr:Type 1 glutamine amidotransferase-like domain-containing protein [bacterium]
MKLLLTSSGISNEAIAKALSELVGRSISELSIIHIPTAANSLSDDKSWAIDDLVKLQKQHFKSIDILDVAAVPPEMWKPRLTAADIISVGGGDEQYLAKVFREIGMQEFLLSVLDTKVYMGTSAGSMVAGRYLPYELLKMIYPEEDFGNLLENPMGFYDSIFIPHLNSKWFTHVTKENLEKIKGKFEYPAYATDDETAIKIDGTELEIIGGGNHWKCNKQLGS